MICISDLFCLQIGMQRQDILAMRGMSPTVAIVTPTYAFNAAGGFSPADDNGSPRSQLDWLRMETTPVLTLIGMSDLHGAARGAAVIVEQLCAVDELMTARLPQLSEMTRLLSLVYRMSIRDSRAYPLARAIMAIGSCPPATKEHMRVIRDHARPTDSWRVARATGLSLTTDQAACLGDADLTWLATAHNLHVATLPEGLFLSPWQR